MDMLKRINTYLDQNGSESRLTHRQERRLRKKAHQDAKASRKQNVYVKADTSAFDEAIEPLVSCYTCMATGDERCVTSSGKPAKASHKGRE